MAYVNYDGKLKTAGTAFFNEQSRGLRYGDGLFETIRLQGGELILADDHFARLWKGMQALHFDIPRLMSPEFLKEEISRTSERNGLKDARVRLSIYRAGGGLYDPENLRPIFIIETSPLDKHISGWNENGLSIGIYEKSRKMADGFSHLKTNNFLPYLLAAFEAKEQRWNDALVLNQYDRVADSTIANLFIVKGQEIFTPALAEGCIAGIMRKYLITSAREQGYTVHESQISPADVYGADECFLTNSIRGIRWVKQCHTAAYTCQFTQQLYLRLRETNPAVFC